MCVTPTAPPPTPVPRAPTALTSGPGVLGAPHRAHPASVAASSARGGGGGGRGCAEAVVVVVVGLPAASSCPRREGEFSRTSRGAGGGVAARAGDDAIPSPPASAALAGPPR